MPDDMISNALVWLSCKLCNFIAEGEALNPIPVGDRSETSHQRQRPGEYGKSQSALLEKWNSLRQQFQIWFNGLPDTFEPTSRYKPRGEIFNEHEQFMERRGGTSREFKASWFASSMCASTMQHYHMAQILLLLNKPQETTAGRSTIRRRFQSIINIGEEAVYHCYQIVYVSNSLSLLDRKSRKTRLTNFNAWISNVSLSKPDDAARVHSVQPLFVAGMCFSASTEQRIVLQLLEAIESDLGWATQYRVQDLREEWKRIVDLRLIDW